MAFDILRLGEEDLTDRPYWKRKEILRDLVGNKDNPTIRFVPYRKDLRKAWEDVIAEGWEGLILKDINSRYAEGERSWSWLKVKNFRTEECEVVGWTDGEGSRAGLFGSLVLARDGRFRGCVGSGFSDYELMKIMEELRSSPAVPKPFPESVVGETYHAVKSGMRVLVKYYETTPSGVMRHPVFLKIL
jgi:bifunctional non-homologous end joining protein LigD